MKHSLILAGALLLAGSLSAAAAAPLESAITAVTVYTDRAVVTRTARVELGAGTAELVFANLPQGLDERSLQVSGRGAAPATILDVSARQTYVDFTPNARVKEIEDQLKELAKQMRAFDDRSSLLQARTAMLDRMETALFAPPTKDVPRPDLNQLTSSLTFLTEQKTEIAADRADLDDHRADLQNRIATAQNQLNELRGAGSRGYKTITVRVSATRAGNLEIALSYAVPGASWSPSYDARMLSGERAVQLGYFGLVRQSTGEDWRDVALTLSTARPSLGGAAPVLNPWTLDAVTPREELERLSAFTVRQDKDEGYLRAKSVSLAAAPAATNMPFFSGGELEPLRDAELAAATLQAGVTSASFKIAAAASIASDNSPQKVSIMSAKLAANPEYFAVPKRLAAAYLTAKVINSSDFPLLAGPMNVFLDGTFVATSGLRTVMAGEKFDLALGADEGIAVTYKRVNKFTEGTGLINSGKRITYDYLITVRNNKRTPERVVVADQVPLSRNEKIVVKQLSPDAGDLKPTDEGMLKWTLDLRPGEQRELPVKFAIEYSKEVVVAGLE